MRECGTTLAIRQHRNKTKLAWIFFVAFNGKAAVAASESVSLRKGIPASLGRVGYLFRRNESMNVE
jgi:hypothetical protein